MLRHRPAACCVMLLCIFALGCTRDIVRSQAEAIQLHTQRFQNFLNREQVEAAVHENQAIELIGAQLRGGASYAADVKSVTELERRGALLSMLREQAAQNWFSLAQYFSTHRHFPQARAIYRRIIDTYGKGGERLYGDYAVTALQDLDILALNPGAEEPAKPSTALSAVQHGR